MHLQIPTGELTSESCWRTRPEHYWPFTFRPSSDLMRAQCMDERSSLKPTRWHELPTSDTSSSLQISRIISYWQRESAPPVPLREHVASVLTTMTPEQVEQPHAISVLPYSKTSSKCFVLQPIQGVATSTALSFTPLGPGSNLVYVAGSCP